MLEPGELLILYGPFKQSGRHTAPGNAAFDANDMCEVARILRAAADKLDNGIGHDGRSVPCHDINGNAVGSWSLTPRLLTR